jgi:TPR repeat protein
MNSQSRLSYSFFVRLLFLAAVSVTVYSGCAWPQSERSATASSSKLHSQAEQGDAVAQYKVALTYLRDNPSDKGLSNKRSSNEDYESAAKWLRASAAQGHAGAEFLLGYLYEHGQGVAKDYAKAAENYRAAALQGHSTAENNLASLYQHGQGVPKDMRQAFEWYLASARHGNQVGQCNVATLYYLGFGIPRDYKEAAKWFRAAADSGSAEAQNSLAVLYYKDLGAELDYGEAARWLRLAAEQGLPSAETNLAYLYEQGIGVPLNYVAAYTWYSRALAAGDASGSERRRQISRLMTRKQVDEASSLLTAVSSQLQKQVPTGAGAFSLLERH